MDSIRRCPDANEDNATLSGCKGGDVSEENRLCRDGLGCVFCRSCTSRNDSVRTSYAAATDDAPAKCETCEDKLPAIMASLGVLSLLTAGACLAYLYRQTLLQKLQAAAMRGSPAEVAVRKAQKLLHVLQAIKTNQLKIIIGLYLIIVRVPDVYEVSLPYQLQRLFDGFAITFSFGIEDFATSLDCLGLGNYHNKVLIFILVPFALAALIVALTIGWRWLRLQCSQSSAATLSSQNSPVGRQALLALLSRTPHGSTAPQPGFTSSSFSCVMIAAVTLVSIAAFVGLAVAFATAPVVALSAIGASAIALTNAAGSTTQSEQSSVLESTLPWVLRLFFLAFPMVTNVAFDAFPCYTICNSTVVPCPEADKRRYLKADVEVECGTPEHDSVIGLAWIAIAMYPFGMLIANAAMLYKARHEIRSNQLTGLSRAIGFLHREYKPQLFWWGNLAVARTPALLPGRLAASPTFEPSCGQSWLRCCAASCSSGSWCSCQACYKS